MEKIIHFLSSHGFSREMIVAIISVLPIFELRGGIPVAHFAFNFSILKSFYISVISNSLIVVPLVYLLSPINKWLENLKNGNNIIEKLRRHALKKSKLVDELEFIGLMLFVSIPLPGSGAWTGALIAFFLKLSRGKSIIFILLGVLIAGILVSLLTYLLDIGIIKNTGIFLKKVGV
jgi:uncharacterized membrane protein